MLILTRRIGESVIIKDDISVCILGIRGNQIRLGIEAPKEIPVHRKEIYQRIQNEKQNEITDNIDQENSCQATI